MLDCRACQMVSEENYMFATQYATMTLRERGKTTRRWEVIMCILNNRYCSETKQRRIEENVKRFYGYYNLLIALRKETKHGNARIDSVVNVLNNAIPLLGEARTEEKETKKQTQTRRWKDCDMKLHTTWPVSIITICRCPKTTKRFDDEGADPCPQTSKVEPDT